MEEVLLLVHRLPYPPDKGDKVRSYHLLRQLLGRYRVHLGCFIDDANDEQYVEKVEALCASALVLPLRPKMALLKSASAMLRNEALSIPYYFDGRMADWVTRTLQDRRIARIIAFSSPMAQYVTGDCATDAHRIMDFVDVDSDKWSQYGRRKTWPLSRVYAREARLLSALEIKIATEFDAVSFVSRHEVDLFDELSPATREKHHFVPNGVATDYFDPDGQYPDPFGSDERPLVFTGMMNYWPNVDAVKWFASKVFPRILNQEPRARFWIVGASPTREVRALQSLPGIVVTGRVPDVRPYLKHAALAVAPLRIARGVQNKVLEAMAMGCSVLCSPQAAAGLEHGKEASLSVAYTEQEFAECALALLSTAEADKRRDRIRRYVIDNYDWQRNLAWFCEPPAEQPQLRAS